MDSPFKGKTGLVRIWHALLNSLSGFKLAFKHESAFRQEVFMAVVMLPLSVWFGRTPVELILLAGTVLLVLIIELLNSGLEAAIDRIGPERHELSKRAKDMGSAAVLLALCLMALTWGLFLYERFH